ncbi:MAG: MOSC domain-containing protein [Armatimonadetes bacterium]|nr:MOSC domain-containing protein [Armatimonadota bacterium]
MGVVAGIFIYPVKSTHRVELTECQVERRGLKGDRRWMIVDGEGQFRTQRDEMTQLALLQATVTASGLRLAAPDRPSLDVATPSGNSVEVTIWGDSVMATDAGDEAARWLTDYIGVESRLVRMPETTDRPVNLEFGREGDVVSFGDAFPILLANQASLDDLNARLDGPVPVTRFRANIMVDGFPALAEDAWTRVQIGPVSFRSPKMCGRCIVTTIDQDTGQRNGTEPLTTLTSYRLQGQAAVFGKYLVPDGEGPIRVGDPVTVSTS